MTSATTRVLALATTSTLAIGLWAGAFAGAAQARTEIGDRGGSGSQSVDFALKAAGYGTRVTGAAPP